MRQKEGSGRKSALSLQGKVGGRLPNIWRDLILIDVINFALRQKYYRVRLQNGQVSVP